jgi:hypothetical protein
MCARSRPVACIFRDGEHARIPVGSGCGLERNDRLNSDSSRKPSPAGLPKSLRQSWREVVRVHVPPHVLVAEDEVGGDRGEGDERPVGGNVSCLARSVRL